MGRAAPADVAAGGGARHGPEWDLAGDVHGLHGAGIRDAVAVLQRAMADGGGVSGLCADKVA